MKKLLVGLLAVLFCCLLTINVTAFAEEIPETSSGETSSEESAEDSAPTITDEQLDKLAELLKDKAIANTGLTDEDITSLTGRIYEWLDGKVSETIIIIVVCVLAIILTVGGVLIVKSVKLKASDKQLNVLKTQYNNLQELLESFKGNAVADSVITATQDYLKGVKEADTAYLAKIDGELQSVYSSLEAVSKAMLLAWANKVPGVTELFSAAPTQNAVANLSLYNKKLEDAIKEKYGEEADGVLANIRKETGV